MFSGILRTSETESTMKPSTRPSSSTTMMRVDLSYGCSRNRRFEIDNGDDLSPQVYNAFYKGWRVGIFVMFIILLISCTFSISMPNSSVPLNVISCRIAPHSCNSPPSLDQKIHPQLKFCCLSV